MIVENETIDYFDVFFQEPNPVLAFKNAIQEKNEELFSKFDPQYNVLELLIERSGFIDQVLTACWKHFLTQHAEVHSLIATGGYGRNELFPYSDIDIIILLNNDESALPETHPKLSEFCNFLWDIGLKLGHSVRTFPECIEKATEDQTIFTSLMEMRHISGNKSLSELLKHIISSSNIWPSESFFKAKIEEQELRYSKYDETAYKLEPNIKESPGGLRDLQLIAWVFKRHYNSATLKELIKYGFIPASEYEELIHSRNMLWRLRFALQALTGRCEDRLLFEYQRNLAEMFHYVDDDLQPNVERFMQFYFKIVVVIEQLNEILLQLFSERFIKQNSTSKVIPITAEFSSVNGYLEVSHKDVFNNNPLALLEIFLLLQQSSTFKGIRATTIRLIRKSVYLIDNNFRHNKKANRLFISILRQPRGITHQLRSMNRYGILAAYLPGFANIVLRMQYDLFHIYTVDEHTLFLVRNLRRFSLAEHNHELPLCNNIFLLIPRPEVLYVAGLFHDIAKGMGGDHSVLGEKIAREFCEQHDINSAETKLITWLVRHHLIMSTTAQKKDISDPEIIHEFSVRVGSVSYLNHLYLLTVADIRATNPSLWNTWKDSLLKELYISAHSALHRGLIGPVGKSNRIKETKKDAYEELKSLGMTDKSIRKAWNLIEVDDYFLRFSSNEIAWHTVAIVGNNQNQLPLVLLRPQSQHGSAEIFIFGKNDEMLFSICTATLDGVGLTILDARLITTKNNFVLNSFQVLEQSGDPITELFREIHICSALRANIIFKKQKQQINIHKLSRQAKHFPIRTQISFFEDSRKREEHSTLMEIITTDRAGLLSLIGQAFVTHNIQLHNAKVTTIGSRAEDIFEISDQHSQPIRDQSRLEKLKSTLIELLDK